MSEDIDAPISESAFSSGPCRSSRPTCLPAYLKDYVTYNVHVAVPANSVLDSPLVPDFVLILNNFMH